MKANFPKDWLTRFLLVLIILLAGVGAVYANRLVRRLVASTTAVSLPGDPVIASNPDEEEGEEKNGEEGQEKDPPASLEIKLPDPDPWDGTSRVNVLVMGPGGYQFRDYLRVGLPLTVLLIALILLLLPVFWPLT